MSKEEFLNKLNEALQGEVSEESRIDTISYYRQYLEDEMRNGKTATEISDDLGGPTAIAKSIIEAEDGQENRSSSQSSSTAGGQYGYETQNYNQFEKKELLKLKTKMWAGFAIIILFIIAIIVLLVGTISALAPILIPLAIIWLLIYFIRQH